MNKISQLRQEISKNGVVALDADDYNELQSEWILRANIDLTADYIPREKLEALFYQAEQERCCGREWLKRIEKLLQE